VWNERVGKAGMEVKVARKSIYEEKQREKLENEKVARRVFMRQYEALEEIIDGEDVGKCTPAVLMTKESTSQTLAPGVMRAINKNIIQRYSESSRTVPGLRKGIGFVGFGI